MNKLKSYPEILNSIHTIVKNALNKGHDEEDDFRRAAIFQDCLQEIKNITQYHETNRE